MPTMPRILGKPTTIAYKILGKPANIAHKKTKQERMINRYLVYQETDRVR